MREIELRSLFSGNKKVTLAKAFTNGTHRQSPPKYLLESLSQELKKFGVSRIARITELDRIGIEVYTVVRPNNYGLSVAQGKGIDRETAKLSGIMEAIEYWHAERPENSLFLASGNDLLSRQTNPDVDFWSASVDPNCRILWTFAEDLVTGNKTAVPFDLVHANFDRNARQRVSGLVATTNGLASGGNLPEAVTHAICEIIERYSTHLFGLLSFEQRSERALDLSSVNDPSCQRLIRQCSAANVLLNVWDATSEIRVPSFIACLSDESDAHMPPGFGAGCHPNRGVALCRSITEAAQSRLTRISGTRDDLAANFYSSRERMRARFLVEQSRLSPRCGFSKAPDFATTCLVEDLHRVVARLADAGHRIVYVVKLANNPKYSVVRVIIPSLTGMEH